MNFAANMEPYQFGTEMRQRVCFVSAKQVTLPAVGTPRINDIMPLSQFRPDGTAGYREQHTDRGHVIGLQFGGPEASNNLVPMFGKFNGAAGAWGTYEQALRTHLAGHGNSVDIAVLIFYESPNTAVPEKFIIEVRRNQGTQPPASINMVPYLCLLHAPPADYNDPLTAADIALRDKLVVLQKEMVDSRWVLETEPKAVSAGVYGSRVAVGGLDASPGLASLAPAELLAFYASRPYSLLDYLWYKKHAEYLLLGFPGLADGIANTTGYTTGQQSAIKKLNTLANNGTLKSDLPSGVFHQYEKYDQLLEGSTDGSAQVDHVAKKEKGGSNSYSNARVISAALNKAFNEPGKYDNVIAKYVALVGNKLKGRFLPN